MRFLYKTYLVDYTYIFNNKNKTILMLHGWGLNENAFSFLYKYLQSSYNIISIHFPPYFLNENYENSLIPLCMYDYLNMTLQILRMHNITSTDVICHSFGFRIALLLNTLFNINKIVITSGAGINLKKSIPKIINNNSKIIFYKHKKNHTKINFEYETLKKNDKLTFLNIINTNLIKYVKLLKCPCFIFWGKHDKTTSLIIYKYLTNNIKNAKHIIVKSDHFAYINFKEMFTHNVINFLSESLC